MTTLGGSSGTIGLVSGLRQSGLGAQSNPRGDQVTSLIIIRCKTHPCHKLTGIGVPVASAEFPTDMNHDLG